MSMGILPECISMCIMCIHGVMDPLELELQTFVSCHVLLTAESFLQSPVCCLNLLTVELKPVTPDLGHAGD